VGELYTANAMFRLTAVVDECGVCGGDGSSCQQLGDINGDGTINVIDIVMVVNLILNDNYDCSR